QYTVTSDGTVVEPNQQGGYVSPGSGSGDDSGSITIGMPGIDTNTSGGMQQPVRTEPAIIAVEPEKVVRINRTEPVPVKVEDPDIGMRRITIKSRTETEARIKVERVSDIPENITTPAGTTKVKPVAERNMVYQYLNVTHENLDDDDIEVVTISFSVNQTWIRERMLNKTDIYLARYYGGQWNRLETRFVNQTPLEANYEAESPGLSIFTIVGGSILSMTNRTCIPYDFRCYGDAFQECDMRGEEWVTKSVCKHGCSENGCIGGDGDDTAVRTTSSWTGILAIGLVLMLLGIVAYYYESRREKLTREIEEFR
ncbi:MAG: hypothetical protein DRO99_03850, partial [Candidatus Aenigmatarchaeota archaeon]